MSCWYLCWGPSSVIMPQVEGGFRKWNDAGHGLDDAPARQPAWNPGDLLTRGGAFSRSRASSTACQLRCAELYANCNGRRADDLGLRLGGTGTPCLEHTRGCCSRGNRTAMHCIGVLRTGLGTAAHFGDAHGADLRAGTGSGMADGLAGYRRVADDQRRDWRCADSDGCAGGRNRNPPDSSSIHGYRFTILI